MRNQERRKEGGSQTDSINTDKAAKKTLVNTEKYYVAEVES